MTLSCCRPINDLEKTLAALVPAAAAAPTEAAKEADDAGACQAAALAAETENTTVAATAAATPADPLESSSIQELLEHMSALETLAVPTAAASSASACSSPSGRRTPGSTCRTPAPRTAAAPVNSEVQDTQQREAAWEVPAAELAVDASSGMGSLGGSAPCSPAAANGAGARCVSHGLELRINTASRDSSAAGGTGFSSISSAEVPARLSYAAAAAPHSPHGSSAGCSSPGKAVCRITQFAAVSASVSQAGQANDSQSCSRTDSGIV